MDEIPFFDLQEQVKALRAEVDPALDKVFSRASFIMGPEVEDFERAFAAFNGANYCIGVGSGTSALKLALQALGVAAGDEVILPAHTYIASALAVSQAGAKPVFVDIDEYYHMDLAALGRAITPRTKAIMAVHLYGQAMDMQPLLRLARSRGLRVLEDACQAHGARDRGRRAGSIADAGCFSFYPSKNLGAWGDGGAVITNDGALADAVRLGRDFGQRNKYEHLNKGENSRLDTLQAAILLTKLKYLDGWNEKRRSIASVYDQGLTALGVPPPRLRDKDAHVYHLYVIELEQRDRVRTQMLALGVQTGIHYPTPIHRQPAYADAGLSVGTFPRTESACERLVSLPMFPEMTTGQAERVVEALRTVLDPAKSAGSKVLSNARA